MRSLTPPEKHVLTRLCALVEDNGTCLHNAEPDANTSLKYRYVMEVCGIGLRLDFYKHEPRVMNYRQLTSKGWTFDIFENRDTRLLVHDSEERFDREIVALKMAI